MLDTIENFLDGQINTTFIEPNPERLFNLITDSDKNQVNIITEKVQEVSLDIFSSLNSGDLLFIDSSHVVKCGSDLQYLLFEVLPRLKSGVFVHFHDIFYPFEYPEIWLNKGIYWNENYFLRAFLAYNNTWQIYFFNHYIASEFPDFIKEKMPLCTKNAGGSLYLRKIES